MTVRVYAATEIKFGHSTWLLYGLTGSGKTTLLGTFPGPIAVINWTAERGVYTLRGHPLVQVYDVDVPEDVPDAVSRIIADHKTRQWKTVAIDGVSTWCELLYRLQAMKGKVEWNHWKNWKSTIFSQIERLRTLDVDVVVTAGMQGKDDETRDLKIGTPAVFGSLASELPSRVEIVIYLETETDARGVPSYKAYPSGKGPMIGRVRGTVPGLPIAAPTFDRIVEQISKPLFHGSSPEAPIEPPAPPPAPPAADAGADASAKK